VHHLSRTLARLAAAALVVASLAAPHLADEPRPDAAARTRLVESLLREIRARYVRPEKAATIEGRLRTELASGPAARAETASALASALATALRESANDLHFDVRYDPARDRELTAAGAARSKRLPEMAPSPDELAEMRERNYGFGAARILDGNVGYLEVTRFDPLRYSRASAVAAMAFVASADAIVVDLRRNPGGADIGLLVSYFFGPRPVELMSVYDRETNTTRRTRTLATVPGRRRPDVDVFLVTGPGTGSAAEAFAFTLQKFRRATTVVGGRTAGAAQGGGWAPLGDGYVVFMPTFRPFDPRTGENWEGVGVRPDVEAPPAEALEVAHFEAVRRLEATAEGPRKRALGWLLPLLGLRAHGPKAVDPAALSRYAGDYDRATVIAAEGQLFFVGASGVRRPLTPLSDGTFLIVDAEVQPADQARLRFVDGPGGAVTGLELLVRDGRVLPRARKG
jgi:hypothetical protein